MSVESPSLPPDPDSEGCLCVVASYSDLAFAVDAAAEEAAKRIMMSPALGDFIELRFRDLGSRPGDPGEHGDAAAAILANELLHPTSGVGRNYFALVIADTSATVAERLLRDCAAVPAITRLPIRFRGVASVDDRQPAPESSQGPEIVVSPTGSWTQDAFIDQLRSYSTELLRHFATGHHPGLSPNDLALLWSENEQRSAGEPGSAAGSGPSPGLAQETVALPGALPEADILAPAAAVAALPESQVREEAAQAAGEPSRPPALLTYPPPSTEPSAAVQPGLPGLRSLPAQPRSAMRHRGPVARWWRGRETELGTRLGKTQACGLLYMAITDDISSDHSAWHTARSMLLDIDEKLAAMPLVAYKVRALQIGQDSAGGTLRAAGQLSRRDIRQSAADADFSAVLGSIRTMLRIDCAAIQALGMPMARPAVVFFATDPPLADASTAAVYRELAQEASIIWTVPRDSADLVAPVFTESPDAQLMIYHQDIADEIVGFLTSSARIREPDRTRTD